MLSELSYKSKVENNQVYFTYPATKRSEKNLWEEKIPPTKNNEIDVDGWHLPGQFEKRVGLCGIWSYMGCLKSGSAYNSLNADFSFCSLSFYHPLFA